MSTEYKDTVQISASMMCIDWLNTKEQLATLEKHNIDYLHWDVVDGRFAPDFTMGSSIINSFRANTKIQSDYHIMAEEPSNLFDSFECTPGDVFTIHQECSRNLHRDLVRVRRCGFRVGVAINPATSLSALDYILEEVDVVLVMTVNPGFKGQELVPQCIRKVEKLKTMIRDMKLETKITVDGNVSYDNIPSMVAAGADILVGGSSGLFTSDRSLEDSILKMHDCINEGLVQR